MIDFKGHRFEKDIILVCVRWYVAYPLSYRNLEEMMTEQGVQVDHTNIYRWVQKFAPQLEAELRRSGNKRPVGRSWRMDETDIKVNGWWKYLYRAVDKAGQTIDFLLTPSATRRPLCASSARHSANTAALEALQEETGATIEIRQNKYLNNLVEQDHRAVKRIVRPMLGFKSFWSARRTLAGIERMHMLKKGQLLAADGRQLSAAEQLYSLAA
jgi:putative transposase